VLAVFYSLSFWGVWCLVLPAVVTQKARAQKQTAFKGRKKKRRSGNAAEKGEKVVSTTGIIIATRVPSRGLNTMKKVPATKKGKERHTRWAVVRTAARDTSRGSRQDELLQHKPGKDGRMNSDNNSKNENKKEAFTK
jgi:hypothetical protein